MIRTRGLRYDYGTHSASNNDGGGPSLSFPNLDAPQGATVLLRGVSGAGKSTWLALAAGLLTATAGEVVVAGQPLAALSRPQRDAWRGRHIGFLPQKLHLSDSLDVTGNLALAFFAAGMPHDQPAINKALASLGVAHLAHRRPSQLSGGQAQRVALARATLMQPRVILADEPTAALDDDAAAVALALLQDCARQCNATLVIATHDQRLHAAMPDAIAYRLEVAA